MKTTLTTSIAAIAGLAAITAVGEATAGDRTTDTLILAQTEGDAASQETGLAGGALDEDAEGNTEAGRTDYGDAETPDPAAQETGLVDGAENGEVADEDDGVYAGSEAEDPASQETGLVDEEDHAYDDEDEDYDDDDT